MVHLLLNFIMSIITPDCEPAHIVWNLIRRHTVLVMVTTGSTQTGNGQIFIVTFELKIKTRSGIVCLFDLILYVPVNSFSVVSGWDNQYLTRINVSCSRTQRSDPGDT